MDINPTNTIFYYRVSTPRQGTQGHALERYAEDADQYKIPEDNRYKDVESGGSFERAGFDALCSRLRSDRSVDVLMVPAHSRLHRDLLIWAQLRDLLLKHNVQLIDLYKGLQPVDLRSIATTVDAALAEEQRIINQRHAIKGHAFRRAQGKSCTVPFGYTLDNDGYCIPNDTPYEETDLTHWAAARAIIEVYLELKSLKGTARELLSRWGKAKHRGHPGSPGGIREWLKNPTLQGHLEYFGWIRDDGERLDRQRKQMLIDNHPRLISQDEWAAIETYLKFPSYPRKKPHRLNRLVFCAVCGGIMERRLVAVNSHTRKDGEKRVYYETLRCKGSYPEAGKVASCETKGSHRYTNIEAQVIQALIAEAGKVAEAVPFEDAESVSPEVESLLREINVLQSISGTELLIEAKEKEIAALSQGGDTKSAVDKEQLKMYQAAASSPDFWEAATDDDLAAMYRFLLRRVDVSPDGSASVGF